ncbi:MAG: hypothetical protein AAGA96_05655 [Verrucomicrobiota bacterium]
MSSSLPSLRLLFGGLILAGCFSSCATSQINYIDESRTASLKQPRSVVVLGLVAKKSNLVFSERERRAILNTFESKLDHKRRKLRVISHGSFEGEAGRARPVGSGYMDSLSSALSPSQIRMAKNSGASFGVLVALSKNVTWCDLNESCTTHEEPVYDKDGNEIGCRTWTEYTTSSRAHRSVEADYLLYDLLTGRKVWSCTSRHTECHSRSSCSEISYPPPPPHPAPPSLADIMANMANAAIRKWP